jgi:hypothetical protein
MSQGSRSQNDGESYYAAGPEQPKPAEPGDSPLFEQVLRETLAASGLGGALSAEELDGLVAVARRHAGQPLVLDPIAVDMVESLVLKRFGHLHRDADYWRNVAREIATALFEVPQSQARITRLWQQLAELAK